MKTILYSLILIATLSACDSSSNTDDDLICTGDCLFNKVEKTGVISFTDCYNKWSITFDEDELQSIIIDPPVSLQVEDLKVSVTAKFFENDFPFLMPDPPGPIQHKIELVRFTILN